MIANLLWEINKLIAYNMIVVIMSRRLHVLSMSFCTSKREQILRSFGRKNLNVQACVTLNIKVDFEVMI